MTTEDYVSFETAKLLKEKGFDEACHAYYHEDDKKLIESYSAHAIRNINNPCFFGNAAPTIQMVMKWLREKYNLHCDISYDFVFKWHYQIISIKEVVQDYYKEMKTYHSYNCTDYSSYEEAADAAIKYCLINLI